MKSVKKVVFAAMAIAIASLGIQPALAHHSGAGFGKDMKEITGTIKEFQFMNPHSWIQVNVPDANGKTVEWSVEWGSPNQLGREGIRPATFTPGTKVTMKVRPMTNGQPIASFVGAKMPDGTVVGKWEDGE
jgi:Family of unknown function (DUF6152)